MRLNDHNSCMYYMLAGIAAKKIGTQTNLDFAPSPSFSSSSYSSPSPLSDAAQSTPSDLDSSFCSSTSSSTTNMIQSNTPDLNSSFTSSSYFDCDTTQSTPPVPGQHQNTCQATQDITEEEPSPLPAFAIVELSGKGTGVVAARDIRRGERILVEKPLIRHFRKFEDADVISQFDKLGNEEKTQVVQLCNVRPSTTNHEILGIIWTNSISISSDQSGLFLKASRFNHACAPNTYNSWNGSAAELITHAISDIREGEEITSSYLKGVASQADRKGVLARDFGFICKCHRCRLDDVEREQSDYRLKRIRMLKKKLAIALPIKRVVGSCCPDLDLFRITHELFVQYQAEGLISVLPYLYAWRLSCRNGLGHRVEESAKRILQTLIVINGEDHPDTLSWKAKVQGARERNRLSASFEGAAPEDEDERLLWLFMSKTMPDFRADGIWETESSDDDDGYQAISDREWLSARRSKR